MKAQLAKAGQGLGLRLANAFTVVKTAAIKVNKSELAEVIIATWCVEFLRTRRLTGLPVAAIVGISALTVMIKLVAVGTSRGRDGDETFVVSDWHASMGTPFDRDARDPHRRVRNHRRRGTFHR